MLRQALARSVWRHGRRPASNAARAFSVTRQRPAEVELTIGMWDRQIDGISGVRLLTNGHEDGKKVSIEGTALQTICFD